MGLRKKKGEVGEGSLYITRTKACRKLQLSLVQFVRLCILKGVYPRKPNSYAKAQKGNTSVRTLYLRTDIKYLSQDPIIWKFREEKVHHRKLRTLHSQREYKELLKLKKQKPTISVDHIIRERYPVFQRALEDLDDALSTCFLYRALPITKGPDKKLVSMSCRFTTEFLHYLIESRALRKAFITYQGYYYRAHIHGCRVTWMVPHPFPIMESNQPHVRIMTSFVRFYATLLGFVNFKLFSSLSLVYPPVICADKDVDGFRRFNLDDKVLALRSLGTAIKKRPDAISRELSHYVEFLSHLNEKALKLGEEEEKKCRAQMTLFQGIKFFLGRETNRESLTLVIRSAGGMVSWDGSLGHGATYEEQDPEIKYQIVDRPKVEVKHISRYYVQPQWVYDSFNAGFLIPVQQYFVGATLPAHLSPFQETYHQVYEPPEMVRLKAMQNQVRLVGDKAPLPPTEGGGGEEEEAPGAAPPGDEDVDFYDEDEDEEEEEEEVNKEVEALSSIVQPQLKNFNTDMSNHKKKTQGWKKRRTRKTQQKEEEQEAAPASSERVTEDGGSPELLKGMCVSRGEPFVRRLEPDAKSAKGEMSRLAAGFIHRKQRRLYDQARKQEQGRRTWAELFKTRRQAYEREMARRAQLQKATKHRDQLKKGARQGKPRQTSSAPHQATEAAA